MKLVTAALLCLPVAVATIVALHRKARFPLIWWLLVGFGLLGVLQLIPLPDALQRFVSPTGYWLKTRVATSQSPANSWSPITLDSGLTREELAFIALLAAFAFAAAVVTASAYATRIAVAALAINGAAVAFFGIAQKLSWTGLFYGIVPPAYDGYPFAAFSNRNAAAGFLNISLGAAIAWTLISIAGDGAVPRTSRRLTTARMRSEVFQFLEAWTAETIIALVCAVFCAVGVIASASRGAVLSAAVAFVALGLCLLFQRRFLLATGLLGGVVGLTIFLIQVFGLHTEVQRRFENTLANRDVDGRVVHWSYMVDAIPDFVRAGAGIGTYRYVHRIYDKETGRKWYFHAENQYLETLINAGVLGALLLVLGVAATLYHLWRALARSESLFSQAIGYGAVYAVTSQLVHAFFDFGLYLTANAFAFLFILSALFNAGSTDLPSRGPFLPTKLRNLIRKWRTPVQTFAVTSMFALVIFALQEYGRLSAVELARCNARFVEDPLAETTTAPAPLTKPVIWPWFAPKQPLSETALRRAIDRMERTVPYRPYDGQLLLEVAHLRLKLHRLREYRRVLAENYSLKPLDAWQMTSLMATNERIEQMGPEQRASLATSIDTVTLVRPAWDDVNAVLRVSPLIGRAHLVKAQLAALLNESTDGKSVERAVLLAGGEADLILVAAVLTAQQGDVEKALTYFRQVITLEPRLVNNVVAYVRQLPGAIAPESYLPDIPAAWLDAASHYGDDTVVRERFVNHALTLVDSQQMQLGPAESLRLKAKGWRLADRLLKAEYALTRAVAIEPRRLELRVELAELLLESKQFDKARAQLAAADAISPGDRRVNDLIVRLEQAHPSDVSSSTSSSQP